MELLEGETLSDRMRRGKLTNREVLQYGKQIAEALVEAHSKGIVHRDLKPANMMLTRNGLKVLDFGIATSDNSSEQSAAGEPSTMGTPAYMAPEQVNGEPAGPAADLFALGLVLYEMVEGALPGESGTSLGSALAKDSTAQIRPFSRGNLPAGLQSLICRLLEADPARRPTSAVEVRDKLSALAEDKSLRRLAIYATAIVVLLLAGAWWWIGARTDSDRGSWEVVRLTKLTSFPGAETDPALSPDGRSVAFTWGGESGKNQDIYVMPSGGGTPRRLTQDPRQGSVPCVVA